MPTDKHEVELTVKIPSATWETLVEYSRECRHDTPASTVLRLLYPTLEAFLKGKGLGVEVGAKASSQALSAALDRVLPQPQAQTRALGPVEGHRK